MAARPAKPAAVTGLELGTITKTGSTYAVPATWNAASGATSYKVTMTTTGGAVLDSGTVTAPAWTARAVAAAGTPVKVTVVPFANRTKGRSASTSATLPDLTPPVGEFTVDWTDATATITQVSLSDDLTPSASIIRTVNWGEPGAADEPWGAGTTLDHTYPAVEARYVPRVSLTDEAGNTVTRDLNAVVVNDTAPPTGTVTASTTEAWATLTPVSLTTSGVSDNWTPSANITRTVNWGDGTAPAPWTGDASMTHKYASAGTFTPTVTFTDEAGNEKVVGSAPVVVTADITGPVVKLTLPKSRRTVVGSWRVLKGRATDAGTGTRWVKVKVVQKRGDRWFAYRPGARRWVKAGTTRASAYTKARAATRVPTDTGAWKVGVRRLKIGVLHYRVYASDRVANLSVPVTRKQRLTRY